MSINMDIELCLLRHGATESNLEGRYLGRTDEWLSKAGISKLEERKAQGIYPMPDIIFSSPMTRCAQTVGILFPDRNCRYIEEWTEIDFGYFEGKDYEELNGNPRYQEWIDSNGTLPFPNGESRENFIRRTLCGFQKMTAHLEQTEEVKWNADRDMEIPIHVVAVVHGGTVMALCSHIFGGEYFNYQVKCGEGYQCRFRYSENGQVQPREIKRI